MASMWARNFTSLLSLRTLLLHPLSHHVIAHPSAIHPAAIHPAAHLEPPSQARVIHQSVSMINSTVRHHHWLSIVQEWISACLGLVTGRPSLYKTLLHRAMVSVMLIPDLA